MPSSFALVSDCRVVCTCFIGTGFVVGGGDWDLGCEDNVKSCASVCSVKWCVWAPVAQVC